MERSHLVATLLVVGMLFAPLVPALANDGPASRDVSAMTALAEQALASRAGLADAAMLAQEQANLATARDLLAILDQEPDSLARSVALAQVATRAQARTLGLAWIEPSSPAHASPAMAARALLMRYGIMSTPEQEHDLATLDALPEPTRGALTRVFDAFLAFDAAAQHAYANEDLAQLQALEDTSQVRSEALVSIQHNTAHGASLAAAGVDLAPVFPARNALLDAVVELRASLPPAPAAAVCTPVSMLPVFSIDLSSCANTYTQNVALLVDAGGDDTYLNNAGGSHIGAGGSHIGGTSCPLPVLNPDLYAAAALIDLAGTDRYVSGRSCGINGGGTLGAGFLLDANGDDTYNARRLYRDGSGTNGGGSLGGVGFLLDANGNDAYIAERIGTNGGGNVGVGFLLDAGGSDTYTAGDAGTNGGAHFGVGFLLDTAGSDTYTALDIGTNGGGSAGVGFLLDAGGSDTYTAGGTGTNGGSYSGVGFLLDASGNDTYTAGGAGTNGGAYLGAGFLLDAAGNDAYVAGTQGTNGGAFGSWVPYIPASVTIPVAAGLLLDAGGTDTYVDGETNCNDCTVVPKGTYGAQMDVDTPE